MLVVGRLAALAGIALATGGRVEAADLYRNVLAAPSNTFGNVSGWSTGAVATGNAPGSITSSDRLVFSNFWTPGLVTTGQALWLNAANSQTVSVSGGAVTGATDLSGNARNVSQTTSSLRPTYVTGSMNGLQVMRFDGTDDYLNLTQFAQDYGQNIMAVVDTSQLQATVYRGFMNRTFSGSPYPAAPYLSGAFVQRPDIYWGSGQVAVQPTANVAPSIVRWATTGSSAVATAITQVNGGAVASNVVTNMPVSTWTTIGMDVASQAPRMDLGEVVIYSPTISADDLARTEAYFSAKWGIALAGSSTNAYKNTVVRANNTAYLGGSQQVSGLLFNGTATTTTLLGGTSGGLATNSLTLGADGIAVAAGVGETTIGAAGSGAVNLVVAADQAWTNDSSALLRASNGVSRAAGDTTNRVLTVGGSGGTRLDGPISDGGASGSLGLTKTGGGLLTLTGSNSHTGVTTISGGTLALGVGGSLSGSPITVGAGAAFDVSAAGFTLGSGQSIGGDGTILGNLVFGAGSKFAFIPDDLLQLAVTSGSASFASTFGVADVLGLDSTATEGTYTLIAGLVDFTNVVNVGEGNAYDLGGGKSAYFQEGSLQLVVVPEPGAVSLAGLGIAAAAVALRRRRAAA